jgi:hypothetical protein
MATTRTRGRGDRDTATPQPPSDAYTGLLAISLVAMIIGCILLFLDWQQYDKKKPDNPPAPSMVKPGGGPPPAGAPTPAPGTPTPAPG